MDLVIIGGYGAKIFQAQFNGTQKLLNKPKLFLKNPIYIEETQIK